MKWPFNANLRIVISGQLLSVFGDQRNIVAYEMKVPWVWPSVTITSIAEQGRTRGCQSPGGSGGDVGYRAKATQDQPRQIMAETRGPVMPVRDDHPRQTPLSDCRRPACEVQTPRPFASGSISCHLVDVDKAVCHAPPCARPSHRLRKRITKDGTQQHRGKSRARQSRPRVSPKPRRASSSCSCNHVTSRG